MQISVESGLKRKLTAQVSAKKISTNINEQLTKLLKTTRLPGFRPGKVPLKVIQQRYGIEVRQKVINELIQADFYQAVEQENLKPVGVPKIDYRDEKTDMDLDYTATFEVYPNITLASVTEIKFEQPTCAVTDNDIAEMIEVLRRNQRQLKAVTRAAQQHDVVDIDFVGTIAGKAFAGNQAKNYQLELGTKQFIAGFEDGLIGKKAGEEVTLKLTFPKDYNAAELRGKEVDFNVKVNTVNEAILPKVDAEFMTKFGVKDGDKNAFENELKRNMTREVTATLNRQTKSAVFAKLCEINTIELPKVLVNNELRRMKNELAKNMKTDVAKLPADMLASLTKQAEQHVALQLIAGEIIKQNKLTADPKKVRAMIEQAAAGYEDPQAIINWYYSDQKKLAEVEAFTLEDNIVTWFLEHAKVTEKPRTFNEVMNNR